LSISRSLKTNVDVIRYQDSLNECSMTIKHA
jgi:hypothetical protein